MKINALIDILRNYPQNADVEIVSDEKLLLVDKEAGIGVEVALTNT